MFLVNGERQGSTLAAEYSFNFRFKCSFSCVKEKLNIEVSNNSKYVYSLVPLTVENLSLPVV